MILIRLMVKNPLVVEDRRYFLSKKTHHKISYHTQVMSRNKPPVTRRQPNREGGGGQAESLFLGDLQPPL